MEGIKPQHPNICDDNDIVCQLIFSHFSVGL